MSPSRTVSVSLVVSRGKGPRLSKLDVLKAHLSGAGLKSWGARYGVQSLHISGKN